MTVDWGKLSVGIESKVRFSLVLNADADMFSSVEQHAIIMIQCIRVVEVTILVPPHFHAKQSCNIGFYDQYVSYGVCVCQS